MAAVARLGKSTIFHENRGFRFGGVQKTKILKSMPLWRIENPLISMQFACYTPPPGYLTRHAGQGPGGGFEGLRPSRRASVG